jgi:hypothetical protein
MTQLEGTTAVNIRKPTNMTDSSVASIVSELSGFETKSMCDMGEVNRVVRKRAVWGPEINMQFAVMEDASRIQSAVDLGKAKRVQSANGLLNEAIEKNSRVTRQKCVVL